MGKDQSIKGQRRGDIIHLKKLFDGRTAEQVHREVALRGRKCDTKCGLDATFRVILYAPVDEAMKNAPELIVDLARKNGGNVPMIRFRHHKGDTVGEQFVRLSVAYGCDLCKTAIERVAAKHPSWAHVEFDYGPTRTKVVSQVPGDG
jgi:hypothetical protein